MVMNKSKFLKAVLFFGNVAETGLSVSRSLCFTVQDYHYHCFRERDKKGNPFGGIRSDFLEFSIVADNLNRCKDFYQCMDKIQTMPFSFIFNADFGPTGRLFDFEDGLITYGYVIDITETCDNAEEGNDKQLLIHVKVLLSNMVFFGFNTVHELEITKD